MDETMAPLTVADTHRLIHEALSESQFAELATNRSVDFAFTWRETVRVRGNAYYQRGSLAAAFRLLPMRIPSFHELGIPQSVIDLIGRRQGLVLVTGPTGSGKSTTLAALVDHINHSRECHVVTNMCTGTSPRWSIKDRLAPTPVPLPMHSARSSGRTRT